MERRSLLAHLALARRLSPHPENLATESLYYILDRSPVAKGAFVRYVAQTGIELPADLMFRTQESGSDDAIPDLVGIDRQGRQALIVEAKFDAQLTGNQPVTYLSRLPKDTDGVLLFVAPARRSQILWYELIRLCRERGLTCTSEHKLGTDVTVVKVNGHHILALTSWRSVLAVLLRALEASGVVDNVVTQVRCVVELLTAHKHRLGSTTGAASAEQMFSPSTPASSATGHSVGEG